MCHRWIAFALLACAASSGSAAASNDDALDAATQAALADAARRTGVPQAQWSVRSAEAVRWPDGSLGCALPRVRYTMAPVDGFRIVIVAGERELDYRAGPRGLPVPCAGGARGGAGGAPTR